MANSLIGRRLGNYKVIDRIGQGGMASVYLGYQESVDRQVAIKVLPPHPGLDNQFIERFQIEARTVARLQHPHILPLYDYGTEDNILYLVMAYISGGTLEDPISEGAMPLDMIDKILKEIAGALDYAHRQDVVHRDIKPGNILIDSEGHALLADFGIVRLADSNLTGTGIVGTPAYMAPEQAQGLGVDARSDIYALGVVVYQMLTGKTPFRAETPMQVLVKVMQEAPPNILDLRGDLPQNVRSVMDRVLAKDPDARYQTASEFATAFSQAISDYTGVTETATQTFEDIPTQDETPTAVMSDTQSGVTDPQTNPTIIVQQATNPYLLLGGFAIIAIALVAVVLLVLNDDSGGDDLSAIREAARETGVVATAIERRNNATDDTDTDDDDTQVIAPAPTEVIETSFGRLTFSASNTPGDSLSLQLQDLAPLDAGLVYAAWLINTEDDDKLNIGQTVVDALGSGSLTYTDADGRTLPAHYNAIALTAEPRDEIGDEPAGDILYSGMIPAEVMTLLTETLIAAEDGFNGGSLLDGARTEASNAENHAGLAARAGTVGGMHTHAEHTINILRGEEEDYNGNGRGENPGRGIGVYFFVDRMENLLDTALIAPEATRSLQIDGEFLRVCLVNTRDRADRVITLEGEMLAETEDITVVEPQAQSSLTITEALTAGVDLNENGVVEAFEGECGLDQIETFGVLVASLDVFEGDVLDG